LFVTSVRKSRVCIFHALDTLSFYEMTRLNAKSGLAYLRPGESLARPRSIKYCCELVRNPNDMTIKPPRRFTRDARRTTSDKINWSRASRRAKKTRRKRRIGLSVRFNSRYWSARGTAVPVAVWRTVARVYENNLFDILARDYTFAISYTRNAFVFTVRQVSAAAFVRPIRGVRAFQSVKSVEAEQRSHAHTIVYA